MLTTRVRADSQSSQRTSGKCWLAAVRGPPPRRELSPDPTLHISFKVGTCRLAAGQEQPPRREPCPDPTLHMAFATNQPQHARRLSPHKTAFAAPQYKSAPERTLRL